MRAAVLRQAGAPLTIEEIDIDDPGPGEVRIRPTAAGVCHSDLHFIKGLYHTPMPCVPGHESAGVVEAVGPDRTARLIALLKPVRRALLDGGAFAAIGR